MRNEETTKLRRKKTKEADSESTESWLGSSRDTLVLD